MRVISGLFKGLNLISWKSSTAFIIRPMTDQVRETVFNILQPYLHKQALVLDLFSGSGSISMEAISRGVQESHGVESHSKSLDLMRQNRDLLKDQSKRFVIHKSDVFDFFRRSRLGPFDIIIADPPFPLKLGEKIIENLVKSHLYIRGTVFVLETSAQEEMKDQYSCFHLFSQRDFNDKKVWFYEARKE